MRRTLAFTVSLASFLLSLAAVALWARSYFYRDMAIVGRAGGNPHLVQSIVGRVHVISDLDQADYAGGITHRSTDRRSPKAIWHGGMSGYPPTVEWHLGFVVQDYPRHHIDLSWDGPQPVFTTRHRLIVVPYWAAAGAFAVPPAIWLVRRRRRWRRSGPGACAACGYDLRATPAADGPLLDRCPECGAARA